MNNLIFNTPDYLINEWPEIFNDINVKTIPIEYLDYIKLTFKTGMIWKINIKEYLATLEADEIATLLQELVDEYTHEIKTIDYKLNTPALKQDITSVAHQLFEPS